jgi:hypothetical protein
VTVEPIHVVRNQIHHLTNPNPSSRHRAQPQTLTTKNTHFISNT